jgi:serine/threonine protein phosphatase 1
MKYVAISDLHGEMNKLHRIMAQLHFSDINFHEDVLVFLGDYVDGGPNSKEVVNYLMKQEKNFPHWVFLMGNHEDMMLSGLGYIESVCKPYYSGHFETWFYQGGEATAKSYLGTQRVVPYPDLIKSQVPREHLEWLRTRPLYHETEDFIFVHAGLASDKRGKFIHPQDSETAPLLWARHWYKGYTNKPVIYGHTCSKDYLPVLYPNTENPTSLGIDTMAHGHGYITAVVLDKSKEPWYNFIRV